MAAFEFSDIITLYQPLLRDGVRNFNRHFMGEIVCFIYAYVTHPLPQVTNSVIACTEGRYLID
jgi:hypothetical protein